MHNQHKFNAKNWQYQTDAALQWVGKSIDATGGKGSAHSFHPIFGWAKAYPETTGYLIETLLAYAPLKPHFPLQNWAESCANWLLTVQLSSGAFPGLLAGNTRPSVFNTSQILFGLTDHFPQTQTARNRAIDWLLDGLDETGLWQKDAFVPGFVPTYYTRGIWAILQTKYGAQSVDIKEIMRKSLQVYAQRFLSNGAVEDAGFRRGESAFTHTLAYTLEGFWASAQTLDEPRILEQCIHSMQQLLATREQAGGRTAGRYDTRWQGDYTFLCVTGNCQLSILCHKMADATGEPTFRTAAHSFLSEIMPAQRLRGNKNRWGALPGSTPFWGAYLPFRYPNWAAKFFLDAMARNG